MKNVSNHVVEAEIFTLQFDEKKLFQLNSLKVFLMQNSVEIKLTLKLQNAALMSPNFKKVPIYVISSHSNKVLQRH